MYLYLGDTTYVSEMISQDLRLHVTSWAAVNIISHSSVVPIRICSSLRIEEYKAAYKSSIDLQLSGSVEYFLDGIVMDRSRKRFGLENEPYISATTPNRSRKPNAPVDTDIGMGICNDQRKNKVTTKICSKRQLRALFSFVSSPVPE